MPGRKPTLYLADLTHTGQIVASNVAPLGIGLLASYLKPRFEADVELFKYPHDLSAALERRMPEVIGFANYSWNCELAYKYAERIKEVSPGTVVVFGGPNYGLSDLEIADFWARYPLIDFYVVFEGEFAFLELLKSLSERGFDAGKVKGLEPAPANCHFRRDGKITKGALLPRVKDLGELGSPYLDGLMDKFFDGVLIPMIHTTRGCPFTCAFCTEGNAYYSKVAQRRDFKAELEYIARRRGSVQDLVITDANFGMYLEDAEKARSIAEIQKIHGWPRRILVSTGKNNKERIINVASTLQGAIHIAASLQSTDAEVLKNIKRSNISIDALNTIVQQSTDAGSPTYTEIILALPGDTLERHRQSLRDVTNAGLGIVRMYQLILLPQTELNTPECREKYGMKTKFRINPRSFGKYRALGKDLVAIESEEICVATRALSEEDYFECRELDLTVETIHNTGMFVELSGLCQWLGHPWFDFLLGFHERRRNQSAPLRGLYRKFTADSRGRLWAAHQDLERDVRANLDRYLADPAGTNEMATAKAVAFFELQDEFHEALFSSMQEVLRARGLTDPVFSLYLKELREFSTLRKQDFIDTSRELKGLFHFDFLGIRKLGFRVDPREHYRAEPEEYRFFHSPEQIGTIRGYVEQYGTTVDGLGRILMRAPVRTMFRDIEAGGETRSGLNSACFG